LHAARGARTGCNRRGRRHMGDRVISRAFVGALLLALLGVQTAAAAEDPAARMVELNTAALADPAAGRFEEARRKLMKSIAVGNRAGLAQHKMMARTYLHLGAVLITGLKERDRGERYLLRALELRPDIQLTRQVATPELQALFASLQARKPGAGAKA